MDYSKLSDEELMKLGEQQGLINKTSKSIDDFKNKIICGDCLDVMKEIPDKSIDMILCDLPYGTTACKWDTIIPFEPLWEQYKRLIKDNGAIVLTASQPFTSSLVMSNPAFFKYEWIWEKSKASNFLLARKQPLKAHENILVFSRGTPKYFPQKTIGKPFKGAKRAGKVGSNSDCVNNVPNPLFRNDNSGDRFPRTIQYFITCEAESKQRHPTQKPVTLFEYLIKTYTNEGDLVLDNCCGSGTTGLACKNTNRNFIQIEKDANYCKIAEERLNNTTILTTP